MTQCAVRESLFEEAQQILRDIVALTQTQINALDANDQMRLMAADKELERLTGAKERAFGALRQHTTDHGC